MQSRASLPNPTQPSPAGSISERLPSLDGWRAASILMVLGAHCKFAADFPAALATPFLWLFDGNLGVRMFFVISGFLITWLMLVEHDRTSPSLGAEERTLPGVPNSLGTTPGTSTV